MGDTIEVTVSIRNVGNRDGMEVPQVYVRDVVSSVITPVKELKGFKKVLIKQGETKEVTIQIPVAELALFNKEMKQVVEPGAFELQIGRASDDIRIKRMITVCRAQERVTLTRKELADKAEGKRDVASIPVVVKGTVRDVQVNPLTGITVKAGNQEVVTDVNGTYSIKALSTDTLTVGGGQYKQEQMPIQGRLVINVRLLNR